MTSLFIDTNLFISILTDEKKHGEIATELLNSDNELHTSILNLMEIRAVLSKRERLEPEDVNDAIKDIANRTILLAPYVTETVEAFNFQEGKWLDAMDCLMISLADSRNCTFVTFDKELHEHGAVHPIDVL